MTVAVCRDSLASNQEVRMSRALSDDLRRRVLAASVDGAGTRSAPTETWLLSTKDSYG